MKIIFTTLFLFAAGIITVSAQTQAAPRNVWARAYTKDKVFFNNDYFLVEDTCAEIVRLGAFNPWTKKFTGKFKDISSADERVVAEGNYNADGLKDGDFVSYYLNGNTEAKGNFTNDMYNGRWDFYYPTGKPKLSLVATGKAIKILDVWNEEGKKTVENGAGTYESVIGPIAWSGKLVAGTPEGKWTAKTLYVRQDEVLGTERFKLGQFVKGSNVVGEYTDSSHILLASPELLHLAKAEKLWMSTVPCHGARQAIATNAQPANGPEQFTNWIAERLGPVLNNVQLNSVNEPIELKGTVLEDGRLTFKNTEGNDRKLVSALTMGLSGLSNFTPARRDGKTVQQELVIIIKYNSSVYTFTYRLLPVGL
jgi:hypothetical protein